jgi:6-phosphogluconolactonase
MKSVEVRKAINSSDVAQQAAHEVVETLIGTLKIKETANIALTGGTVGILTLDVLSKIVEKNQIDFSRVHFWWGDERYVSSDSKDRNANQAREALLNSLEIPEQNIHEFPSTDSGLTVDEARDQFEQTFLTAFNVSGPVMDLTLLGMGPDGHVASLFPGMSHLEKNVVSITDSPKPPAERLSLSMEVINSSEKIVFVVSGIDKSEAVEDVHKNPECELPAAKVSAKGLTLWIIDEAAGASFWSC